MTCNGKTIGVMGSPQINHLMPVLEEQFKVKDIQKDIAEANTKLGKVLAYVKALNEVDIVYNVYTEQGFYKRAFFAHILGKKVVTHWIGTDVYNLVQKNTDVRRLSVVDKHIVCFKELQKRLKENGIDAPIVPITPFNMHLDLCPLPTQHAVMIYMPDGREGSYGYDEFVEVFQRFSELDFYVVANTQETLFDRFDNVHVMGWLDQGEMEKLYEKITILLRIHRSDGLSMMVLEALAKGREVIWNQEYELSLPGANASQIINSLERVLQHEPQLNESAHDYIVKTYTKDNFLSDFMAACEEL